MKLQAIASANKVISQSELVADSELIKEIQSHLARIGLSVGQIDGIWGPKTQSALAQFCTSVHLDNHKTGKYGPTFAKELSETLPLAQPLNPPRSNVNAMLASGNQTRSIDIKSEHIQLILQECQKQGIVDKRQVAYVLATTYHETAHTYRPIDEIGSHSYLMRYEGRLDLGNSKPGDGPRFKG